ncbi:MAG TPA: ABC transporter permease [Pyrinomonadaceae bacterium]|jgi:ABC-2 type transport system permease protein
MRRITAQARKELTQIFRDRLTLALALPLALLALLGTAISLSVKGMPVVVQDLDDSPLSRRYVESISSSLTFRVAPLWAPSRPTEALEKGGARAVVIIPEDFGRDLLRGRGAEAQWLVDASDANTANRVRAAAAMLTQNFAAAVRPGAVARPAVRAELRFWYNPGRDSRKYIGSGAFAVLLALFPPLLAALAVSREGEQHTILQVYVSGIPAHEYLLGKVLGFMAVALAEWALLLVAAFALFGLRFAGDVTPLLASTVVYLFATVSFGVMIGAAIPNQAAAIQATQVGAFLLSFLLSGFIFPVSNIPAGVRWISALVPARYYIEVARDAFLRGGGWPAVWEAPPVLALVGGLFFLVAWLRMRRMQVEA